MPAAPIVIATTAVSTAVATGRCRELRPGPTRWTAPRCGGREQRLRDGLVQAGRGVALPGRSATRNSRHTRGATRFVPATRPS